MAPNKSLKPTVPCLRDYSHLGIGADRAQGPLRDRRRHAGEQRQDHRPLGGRESPIPYAATWPCARLGRYESSMIGPFSLSGLVFCESMAFQPMPLSRKPVPFDHPDWVFALKYDGFRLECLPFVVPQKLPNENTSRVMRAGLSTGLRIPKPPALSETVNLLAEVARKIDPCM